MLNKLVGGLERIVARKPIQISPQCGIYLGGIFTTGIGSPMMCYGVNHLPVITGFGLSTNASQPYAESVFAAMMMSYGMIFAGMGVRLMVDAGKVFLKAWDDFEASGKHADYQK